MDPLHQDRLRIIKWPWILAILALFAVAVALTLAGGWQAHAREWLNLIVRWLHIIYGIAWIGASFYFIFLENALERQGVRAELSGNLWAIHGGGIYYTGKIQNRPQRATQIPALVQVGRLPDLGHGVLAARHRLLRRPSHHPAAPWQHPARLGSHYDCGR
jgi:hypothetical protein